MLWVTVPAAPRQKLCGRAGEKPKITLAVLNLRSSCFGDATCHDFRELKVKKSIKRKILAL